MVGIIFEKVTGIVYFFWAIMIVILCIWLLSIVSLWRSFVTSELASRLGLKNRHGHWLCRMSTGRMNGLM